MKTEYTQSMRGYWGTTLTEADHNGQAWQIETGKRASGRVVCVAVQGDLGPDGFSYMPFTAKKIELTAETTPCTQAAVKRVHEAGLALFAQQVSIIQPPAYRIEVGQVLFTDPYGNRRAIYEIKSPGHFKTVTLDGKLLKHDSHVRKYGERHGIGTYYREGDIISVEEVTMLVVKATKAMEEADQAERERKAQLLADTNAKVEAGAKVLPAIPTGVVAVIIAEKVKNTSDPMSDYHGSTVEETVYLAWSTNKRDLFKEMRTAAEKFEPTRHLGTGKGVFKTFQVDGEGYRKEFGDTLTSESEAIQYVETKNSQDQPIGYKWEYREENIEHREKYSMGAGYYLKDGHSNADGWCVSKENIGIESLKMLQIAAAEGRLLCNAKPEPVKAQAPGQENKTGEQPALPSTPSGRQVQIIDYSEKAIAVIGDTKPIKDLLKSLGGRVNYHLTCGIGWVFPKTKLNSVVEALKATASTVDKLKEAKDALAEEIKKTEEPETEFFRESGCGIQPRAKSQQASQMAFGF